MQFASDERVSDEGITEKLIYASRILARSAPKDRPETNVHLAFEATHGQHNEWQLSVPQRLAEILPKQN
jgi:hypothetical protein